MKLLQVTKTYYAINQFTGSDLLKAIVSSLAQHYITVLETSESDVLGPQAIDIEAIKELSFTSRLTQEEYKEKLRPRDGYCIFTGLSLKKSMHIIPFVKQDEVGNGCLLLEVTH